MEELTKQDKRIQILRAAVKVFSRHGFYKAKVEEIAKQAGIGKGTVYEYFPSKKELFQEMIKASLEQYTDLAEKETKSIEGCAEKLAKIIDIHTHFVTAHKDLAKILLNDPGGVGESLKRWMMTTRVRMIEIIEDIVSSGIKQGVFREVDPTMTAQMFLGAIGSVVGKLLFFEETINHKDLKEKLMDLILNGISA